MKSRLTTQERLTRGVGVALSAPALLLVILFFAYPFLLTFTGSLTEADGSVGLGNYEEAITRFSGDIWYTLGVTVVSVVLVLILAALVGGMLRLVRLPAVEFLFAIPLFIPYVVVGHAMRVLLAPRGTLNSLLSILPFYDSEGLPSFIFGTAGLITALVWKHMGLALLLVLGAYRGVSDDYLDAGRTLGAGPMRLITQFLTPMSLGTFGVVAILIGTSMLGNFSIPAMLDSGNGNTVLMIRLYDAINLERNEGLANAIGVITYLLSIGAAIYYLYSLRKKKQ